MAERWGTFRPRTPQCRMRQTAPGRGCLITGGSAIQLRVIGPAGPFPALRVQLTQATTRRPVTATVYRAPLVRSLPAQARIGPCSELFQVRASLLGPLHSMVQAQTMPADAALAPAHAAGAAAEHRIVGSKTNVRCGIRRGRLPSAG